MAEVGDGDDVHSVVSHDPRYLSEWRVGCATHDARVHAIAHADLVTGHQTTAVSGRYPASVLVATGGRASLAATFGRGPACVSPATRRTRLPTSGPPLSPHGASCSAAYGTVHRVGIAGPSEEPLIRRGARGCRSSWLCTDLAGQWADPIRVQFCPGQDTNDPPSKRLQGLEPSTFCMASRPRLSRARCSGRSTPPTTASASTTTTPIRKQRCQGASDVMRPNVSTPRSPPTSVRAHGADADKYGDRRCDAVSRRRGITARRASPPRRHSRRRRAGARRR